MERGVDVDGRAAAGLHVVIGAGAIGSGIARALVVPSGPPRTQREAVDDLARAAGLPAVPVKTLPATVVRAAGVFSPLMRELRETRYQFAEDFVMDSSAAQETFGIAPTPWSQVLESVLRSSGWQSSMSTAGNLGS